MNRNLMQPLKAVELIDRTAYVPICPGCGRHAPEFVAYNVYYCDIDCAIDTGIDAEELTEELEDEDIEEVYYSDDFFDVFTAEDYANQRRCGTMYAVAIVYNDKRVEVFDDIAHARETADSLRLLIHWDGEQTATHEVKLSDVFTWFNLP